MLERGVQTVGRVLVTILGSHFSRMLAEMEPNAETLNSPGQGLYNGMLGTHLKHVVSNFGNYGVKGGTEDFF